MALNSRVILFPSAARAVAQAYASADQINPNGRGVIVVVDVTAVTDTPSIVFTIQGKDPVSGKYYTLLASAAVATVSTVIMRVYPGLTAAANLTATDVLPFDWRVIATHGDTDSATYTVTASVIC